MTRFQYTLAGSIAATVVFMLFIPDILLIALMLTVGRTARRVDMRARRWE